MAATSLTAQTPARTGVALTEATPDAVDGVVFDNTNHNSVLLVRNGGGAPITVTVDVIKTVDGIAIPDKTYTVAAGELYAIGPLTNLYDQADSTVKVTFSAVASVTTALITV